MINSCQKTPNQTIFSECAKITLWELKSALNVQLRNFSIAIFAVRMLLTTVLTNTISQILVYVKTFTVLLYCVAKEVVKDLN